MSTVIKFRRSSKFESVKKTSNQLLSDKELRRIFQFKDHDILAYKVLDKEVNEYLDFEFKNLNELDKTKNIYMKVQKFSNKTLLGEKLPEIGATTCTCTSSISQESPLLNVATHSNDNLVNEIHKILIKEESCLMDNNFQIEIFDHIMEDKQKNDEEIQDKQTQTLNHNSSESYKIPLEIISHYPTLCSALISKKLIMDANEDTLLRILLDSIKIQSFNHAVSYEIVVDSLFLHYPYLAENYGNYITSKNIWIEKLKKKFANDNRSSQETRSLDDSCLPPSKIRKLNALEQQSESLDYGKKMASSCSKKLTTIQGNANAEASQNSNDLDSVLNVNECGGYSDTINEGGSFADSDACVPDNSGLNEKSLLKRILERVTRTERFVKDILKDQKTLINAVNMKNKASLPEIPHAEQVADNVLPVISQIDIQNQSSAEPSSSGKEWPSNGFIIRENRMSKRLRDDLNSVHEVEFKSKRQFLLFLYEEMIEYSFYFTKYQYTDVARAVIDKYPALRTSSDREKSLDYWRCALTQKTLNMRKGRDRSIPCVATKITQRNEKRQCPDKNNRLARRMPSNLTQTSIFEDADAVLRHKIFMKTELKKRNPNRRKIDTSMTATFDDRRKLIVEDNILLVQLIEEYPALCDSQQIKYEFTRISDFDIEHQIQESMKSVAKGILKLDTDEKEDNCMSEEEEIAAALVKITCLLGENLDYFESPTPEIKFEGAMSAKTTATIYIEGNIICTTEGVLESLAVWFATFYIFNLKFSAVHKNTLVFIQKVLLGLKDKFEMPSKVLKILKRIKINKNLLTSRAGRITNIK